MFVSTCSSLSMERLRKLKNLHLSSAVPKVNSLFIFLPSKLFSLIKSFQLFGRKHFTSPTDGKHKSFDAHFLLMRKTYKEGEVKKKKKLLWIQKISAFLCCQWNHNLLCVCMCVWSIFLVQWHASEAKCKLFMFLFFLLKKKHSSALFTKKKKTEKKRIDKLTCKFATSKA